ncbi:MAG: hypothetical protein AAF587_18200 [Bacteroidota bacterium]
MKTLVSYTTCLLFLLLPYSSSANMASPTLEGTLSSSPFTSKDVDILYERLKIVPDSDFTSASFFIEYHIETQKSGTQIPLLFYASEYKEDFEVWIDEQAVNLLPVPEQYKQLEGTPFSDFGLFFDEEDWQQVPISFLHTTETSEFHIYLNDLKYFELDLTSGKHTISIHYKADRWVNRNQWMKIYDFRYALSPARYWKSFGGLEVILDASKCSHAIQSNLGPPTTGDISSLASWTFDTLPADILRISFEPDMPAAARVLTDIALDNIGLLVGFLFMLFHLAAIYFFRKANPFKYFSWVMIVGSFLIPFLALCVYVFSFDFVRLIIGEHASNYHFSYVGMYFVLYPFILPVYFLMMWGADWGTATFFRRQQNKTAG